MLPHDSTLLGWERFPEVSESPCSRCSFTDAPGRLLPDPSLPPPAGRSSDTPSPLPSSCGFRRGPSFSVLPRPTTTLTFASQPPGSHSFLASSR